MSKHSRFNTSTKRVELYEGANSKDLLIEELTKENERLKKEVAELREKAGQVVLDKDQSKEEEEIIETGGNNV